MSSVQGTHVVIYLDLIVSKTKIILGTWHFHVWLILSTFMLYILNDILKGWVLVENDFITMNIQTCFPGYKLQINNKKQRKH